MKNGSSGFFFQNKNRSQPNYEAVICTKAALEDLCLELGKCDFQ